LAECIFIPQRIIFPLGIQVIQLHQEVIGLMSGELIVSARPKIDAYPYKFILNTLKIAVF